MTEKFLYHGSQKLIKGKLIPKKAEDLSENPSNVIKAVYATNKKEVAIAMAIISDKHVLGASLLTYRKGKPLGKVYLGWPKRKYVYLYVLDRKEFKKSRGVKDQYFSLNPIKPLGLEKIKVEDYMRLIKKATKKEIKEWSKKYKDW